MRPEDPRTAAWHALVALERGEVRHLDGWDAADAGLLDSDAGLARELILGCLYHARLYDALSDRFLRSGRQPIELRVALRIAAHQLFGLDRIPLHAAVGTAVDIVKHGGFQHLAGVANAVARKLAALQLPERIGDGPLGRIAASEHPTSLAVCHGLPDMLVEDLAGCFDGHAERTLAALNARPHLCTRTRPNAPAISGASILKRDGPWTWWGDPRDALRGPVADGRCVVQDRAQGRVADAVIATAKAQRGDVVLDLCAAPGGKSLALHDAGLVVVSNDVSSAKVGDMPRDLRRVVSDGLRPALAGGFEIVLVDAPCSNTGVLGRRPEARLRYNQSHRGTLIGLQRKLLRSAAALVAPGGRLVYSTCSVVPLENQGIAHMLDGWRLLGEHTAWPGQWEAGGYVAVLIKKT